jgi:hypothetical protein
LPRQNDHEIDIHDSAAVRRNEMSMAVRLTRRVLDLETDLSPVAQFIFMILAFTANAEDGTGCYPRIDTLVRQTHFRRAAVLKGLSELERKGWIETKRRGQRSADRTINVTKIANHWKDVVDVYEVDPQRPPDGLREVHDVDFSYERQDRKTLETTRSEDGSKVAVLRADADHASPSDLSPAPRSFPSKPSSTIGVVSTSVLAKPTAAERKAQLARFEALQAQHAAEADARQSRRRRA